MSETMLSNLDIDNNDGSSSSNSSCSSRSSVVSGASSRSSSRCNSPIAGSTASSNFVVGSVASSWFQNPLRNVPQHLELAAASLVAASPLGGGNKSPTKSPPTTSTIKSPFTTTTTTKSNTTTTTSTVVSNNHAATTTTATTATEISLLNHDPNQDETTFTSQPPITGTTTTTTTTTKDDHLIKKEQEEEQQQTNDSSNNNNPSKTTTTTTTTTLSSSAVASTAAAVSQLSQKQENQNTNTTNTNNTNTNHELSVLALGEDFVMIHELMERSANEDLIVNQLLTQFPTYGTASGTISNSYYFGTSTNSASTTTNNFLSLSPNRKKNQDHNHNNNNNKNATSGAAAAAHVDFWLGPFARKVMFDPTTTTHPNQKSSSRIHDEIRDDNDDNDNDNNNDEYDKDEEESTLMFHHYQQQYDHLSGGGGGSAGSDTNGWGNYSRNKKIMNHTKEDGTKTTTTNSSNNNNKNKNNTTTTTTTTTNHNNTTTTKNIFLDWDEEEQSLWKETAMVVEPVIMNPSLPVARSESNHNRYVYNRYDVSSTISSRMNPIGGGGGGDNNTKNDDHHDPTNSTTSTMNLDEHDQQQQPYPNHNRRRSSIKRSSFLLSSDSSSIGEIHMIDEINNLQQSHASMNCSNAEFGTNSTPLRRSFILSSPVPGGGKSNTSTTPATSTTFVDTQNNSSISMLQEENPSMNPSQNHNNSSLNLNQKNQDERQYWMPDQLCKQCYCCEVPFTVFRRRHHCRLCGQVFCNTCSAYFVPTITTSTPSATTTTTTTGGGGNTLTTSVVLPGIVPGIGPSNVHDSMSDDPGNHRGNTNSNNNSSIIQKLLPSMALTGTPSSSLNTNNTLEQQQGGLFTPLHSKQSTTSYHDHGSTTTNNNNTSTNASGTSMMGSTSRTTIRVCKLCYDQVSTRKGGIFSPNVNYHESGVKKSNANNNTISSTTPMNNTTTTCNTDSNQTERRKRANQNNIVGLMSSSRGNHGPFMKRINQDSDTGGPKDTTSPITPSSNMNNKNIHDDDDDDVDVDPRSPLVRISIENPDYDHHTCSEMKGSSSSLRHASFVSPTAISKQLLDGNSNSNTTSILEGKRHLGLTAAKHLQAIARELLKQHAPLLWNSSSNISNERIHEEFIASWVNKLLELATRCCATVNPNVKKGDLLDIRPYIKIKVIPGSSYQDCQYISGVLFRKTVTHKKMAKELLNPRIMLLSGGIEFARSATENRFASLETLFEQEDTYMEILVGKILKLEPDVLLLGRSASRKAQELLLQANVVLIQHVKVNLLNRISRQTGATIISSTDHVMNQFGMNVLGKCHRFRLVTFRDNEAWTDQDPDMITTTATNINNDSHNGTIEDSTALMKRIDTVVKQQYIAASGRQENKVNQSKNESNITITMKKKEQKSIKTLLADPKLSNHERQAVLAANQLGEGFMDGTQAMKSGLAKRGVAQTYIMFEGCPKQLGCTVVLRGARLKALKEVKLVFRFLTIVAYNLKLETCYLRERGATIRSDYQVDSQKHTCSSSLCVDYGTPPGGRLVKPWNGGNSSNENPNTPPTTTPSAVTAFDHQSILITSVWMTDKTQCCPAEVKGICYYSLQDVSLGQFLRDSCFNLSLKCQNPSCKKSVLDHTLSFVHNDGLINIAVEEMEHRLQPSPLEPHRDDNDDANSEDDDDELDRPIATWTYCQKCRKVVTPLAYISEDTWKWSFGKFLEVFFYNRDAIMNSPDCECSCNLQKDATLYYGCGKLAARFTYERITPFGVFVRRCLPIDLTFHMKSAMFHLSVISAASAELFVKFDKHIEKVSREARYLLNSTMSKSEYLQIVLSELNRIGLEVDHAAKTLQEKIGAITDNVRKHDDIPINGSLFRFPWFARKYLFNLTSAWNEKLRYTGQAISAMKKIAASASRYDNNNGHGQNITSNAGDPYHDELIEGMKRLRQLIDHYANLNVTDTTHVLPAFPGTGDALNETEYDDDFDDPESTIDFSDGVDADVLASRRRFTTKSSSTVSDKSKFTDLKPSKALGTRRSVSDHRVSQGSANGSSIHEPTSSRNSSTPPKPTPGGAVKSAITRFFNRGGRDYEQYVVDLGIFIEGRPRLPPGVNGIVIPVRDAQLSTIIAYSLASEEYAKQLKHFARHDGVGFDPDNVPSLIEKNRSLKPDLDAGIENPDVMSRPDRRGSGQHNLPKPMSPQTKQQQSDSNNLAGGDLRENERRLLARNKSHIKHTFRDVDEKGQVTCKFVCTTYWATQFHAVRQVFLSPKPLPGSSSGSNQTGNHQTHETAGHHDNFYQSAQDVEQCYIESLSSAESWAASGGKSGASFARSSDDRFVIKCISRTELQMFLDCAPAYFEYLTKAFFHGLPTVLCKIVGVYQIGVHNKLTGKRSLEQVAVMQNIFYKRRITKIFDLKGSLRGRFASQKEEIVLPDTPSRSSNKKRTNKSDTDGNNSLKGTDIEDDQRNDLVEKNMNTTKISYEKIQSQHSSTNGSAHTLLDGDFLEFTLGRPMPLTDRAKAVFQMSILNDTLFLSIINVLDYSILVGVDEESRELVVGIIDFMRQYDILKQMERVGKSLPMVVGSEAPTIIQPPLYKARFTNAMERYFMTVPSKWTTI